MLLIDLGLEPLVLWPLIEAALVQRQHFAAVVEVNERAPAKAVLAHELDVLTATRKLLKRVRADVALVEEGRLRGAALPQAEIGRPPELLVEKHKQPTASHGVDLGELRHLVASAEDNTCRVLGRRCALRQNEAAAVLRVKHLVGDCIARSARDLGEQLATERECDRILLKQAARPRVEVLGRRCALDLHHTKYLECARVIRHDDLDGLAQHAGAGSARG
mmetsp:Transcript_48695/g.103911  ORF Transcript_48695/g.103911 Transcript_48695/m.103911 type:complete len:220 (-) Transcript_48695:130-789(-)